MENTKRIILDLTEINGEKVSKKVIDIVPRERFSKCNKKME